MCEILIGIFIFDPDPFIKFKFKVVHMSAANIWKMVANKAIIIISIKKELLYGFSLAYLDLTMADSKGKNNTCFDSEYLEHDAR